MPVSRAPPTTPAPGRDDPALVEAVEQLAGDQQPDEGRELGGGDEQAELCRAQAEVALQLHAQRADALHEEAGRGLGEGGDAQDDPAVVPRTAGEDDVGDHADHGAVMVLCISTLTARTR
jgi:hypothetical protein